MHHSDEFRVAVTEEIRAFMEESGISTDGSDKWQLKLWMGVAWESHLATLIVSGLEVSCRWQSGDIEWRSEGLRGVRTRASGWLRVGLDDPGCFEAVRDFVRRGQTGELPSGYWDVLRGTVVAI